MLYKRTGPKSDRKKLREQIGRLLLEKLKKDRHNKGVCQICGRSGVVGKFHILAVGTHPRLEFSETNILLTCWLPCHFFWHHGGPNDPRNKRTLERIAELLGPDWEQRLREEERMMGKHDELYLLAKLQELKKD